VGLDVRVIATTNRRLREEVAAGRFREDLYYRLNVFPLATAALRERRDDILPLAMRLLAAHSRPGQSIPALAPDAAQLLLTYRWPGNVRELENVMQRALVMCDTLMIRDCHIVFEPAPPAPLAPGRDPAGLPSAAAAGATPPWSTPGMLAESLALAEQKIIIQALRSHESRERIAERLGISPRTLRYKLARLRRAGVLCDGLAAIDESAP
jgi:two-component system response regulator FlrC